MSITFSLALRDSIRQFGRPRQVPSVPEVFDTPFLDRGVRALVETGSTVYVARLDAVEAMPGFVPTHKLSPDNQERISIVWNTGRCGSTLMNK